MALFSGEIHPFTCLKFSIDQCYTRAHGCLLVVFYWPERMRLKDSVKPLHSLPIFLPPLKCPCCQTTQLLTHLPLQTGDRPLPPTQRPAHPQVSLVHPRVRLPCNAHRLSPCPNRRAYCLLRPLHPPKGCSLSLPWGSWGLAWC
jgi:hypothetical protein